MESKNILIVEDDNVIIELLQDCLKKDDINTLSASNGVEALKMLKLMHIDLLITDLMMPKMGGEELIKNLREFAPKLPVVIFSGYQAENLDEHTVFLGKPLSNKILMDTILKALKIS